MVISACIHNDNEIYCYKGFELYSKLPKVNDIFTVSDISLCVVSLLPITIYCDQLSDDVFQFDFYYIIFGYLNCVGEIYDYISDYVCVKKEV